MSVKNSYVTSDYIEWDVMLNLVRNLHADGNYRMSLLIGCGCFFGLRISDLLSLTWSMLLDESSFVIIEKKTKKRREIKINRNFRSHIVDVYRVLKIEDKQEKCFLSAKKCVYSIQRINVIFKDIKRKYGLNIANFSTHSMRKTFGRKVIEASGDKSEFALIKLSELFNHADVTTTRRYLGLRTEELMEMYDLLDF